MIFTEFSKNTDEEHFLIYQSISTNLLVAKFVSMPHSGKSLLYCQTATVPPHSGDAGVKAGGLSAPLIGASGCALHSMVNMRIA